MAKAAGNNPQPSNRASIMSAFTLAADTLEFAEVGELIRGLKLIEKGGKYKAKELKDGMWCVATWPEDNSKPEGTIEEVKDFTVKVKFDDGETWWIPIAFILKAWKPSAKELEAAGLAPKPEQKDDKGEGGKKTDEKKDAGKDGGKGGGTPSEGGEPPAPPAPAKAKNPGGAGAPDKKSAPGASNGPDNKKSKSGPPKAE